ncbi:MAG: hypothetical protein JRI58_14340 [Deltaproteobacteria bacterium]|nr:hypothetical protein [Deltaproteobacteria bacterium]
MKKSMWRSKTTWTGIAGLVTAAGGFLTGTLPLAQAIQLAVTALIGVFLRQGVENLKG